MFLDFDKVVWNVIHGLSNSDNVWVVVVFFFHLVWRYIGLDKMNQFGQLSIKPQYHPAVLPWRIWLISWWLFQKLLSMPSRFFQDSVETIWSESKSSRCPQTIPYRSQQICIHFRKHISAFFQNQSKYQRTHPDFYLSSARRSQRGSKK